MTNWHVATGRLWKFGIISVVTIAFFHMALDSAVTKLRWDMEQGIAKEYLERRIEVTALQEQVSVLVGRNVNMSEYVRKDELSKPLEQKPVDLSGYVKRDELMRSVFKGGR